MSQDTSMGETQMTLPSLPVRIVRVFVAPGELFDALRERPVWLDALLVTIVVALLIQFVLPVEIFREAVMSGLPSDASPEQIEATENSIPTLRVIAWISTVIMPPLLFALIAGALKLLYSVLLGGAGTFKQLFSATAHAQIVNAVGGLLVLPLILTTGDPRQALSLQLLVPMEREGWLFGFLNGLNFFGMWTMIVLGIAVSRIYPKVSAASAIGVLMGAYVVLKAVFAFAPGAG